MTPQPNPEKPVQPEPQFPIPTLPNNAPSNPYAPNPRPEKPGEYPDPPKRV